jgi:hypothetical protein
MLASSSPALQPCTTQATLAVHAYKQIQTVQQIHGPRPEPLEGVVEWGEPALAYAKSALQHTLGFSCEILFYVCAQLFV